MDMYVPFILGIILQIGAAVGVTVTGPRGVRGEDIERIQRRALDIDSSQSVASLLTLVGAAAFAPGLPTPMRAGIGVVAAALMPIAPWSLSRISFVKYADRTFLGLTLINQVLILLNVLACASIWLLRYVP